MFVCLFVRLLLCVLVFVCLCVYFFVFISLCFIVCLFLCLFSSYFVRILNGIVNNPDMINTSFVLISLSGCGFIWWTSLARLCSQALTSTYMLISYSLTGVFKTTQPPQTKFTACNLKWTSVNQTRSQHFECSVQKICLSDQLQLSQLLQMRVLDAVGLRLNISK